VLEVVLPLPLTLLVLRGEAEDEATESTDGEVTDKDDGGETTDVLGVVRVELFVLEGVLCASPAKKRSERELWVGKNGAEMTEPALAVGDPFFSMDRTPPLPPEPLPLLKNPGHKTGGELGD